MTLQEAKDQIAKKYGYDKWYRMDMYQQLCEMYNVKHADAFKEAIYDEAAELYARSKLEGLQSERDDLKLETQVANTSIDLLSCQVKELERLLEVEKERANNWRNLHNELKVCLMEENERLKLRRADWPESGRDMSGPPYPIVDFE